MDFIAAIRDILISLYLILGVVLTLALLVFAYLLYKAMRGLIGAATRATENVGKVTDAAVAHIVTPLEEGMSIGSVAGNAMGFATGFIAGLRGRSNSNKDKGKEKADDGPAPGAGKKKHRWPF
jgi:hypothetical protein